ncbi:MAG: glycoside hydrolase family 88 protein [Deltaproteobacteria bacterium]|nr:glycoside hydrolase family 88 protein [Deltaproteobacteria bacterium]
MNPVVEYIKTRKVGCSIILCNVLLLILNVGAIYYYLPWIVSGVQNKVQIIRQGDMKDWSRPGLSSEYFVKIKEISIEEMFSEKTGLWWPTAILADAMERCHEIFGISNDLDYLIKFYDSYIDHTGSFRTPGTTKYLGNMMHGNTLIYLEQITGRTKYSKTIEELYASLMSYRRTRSGIIPYREKHSELVLVDSLGMICPFLARYGKIYGKQQATRMAVLQIVAFINHGVDPVTGLPYHGYISESKEHVGILGWGRGTGWYLYGLVGILEYLPVENSHRGQMIAALERLAESLHNHQNPDGSWSWSITNPYARKETSGTAMIAYAIEKAIGLRLLSQEYYQMLDKAHNALMAETTEKGFLIGASGDCGGIGRYSQHYGHNSWVQGATTAFNALLLNRNHSVNRTK